MSEKLFINAKFPDFEANRMVWGEVGVSGGKIDYVHMSSEHEKPLPEQTNPALPPHGERIDVHGHVLSPGFVDIHMHEENFVEEGYKYIVSKMLLRQGVTTCVGGNCGNRRSSIKVFRNGLERLGGSPVNYMMLVGYNSIREEAGVPLFEKPTKEAWEAIRAKIEEDIAYGACGLSFGLEYGPGIHMEEMLRAVDLLPDKGTLVSAHYRKDATGALDSIREMIELQSKIENPFQISHLSSCSAMGQMREALEVIHEAIDKYPTLNYDTYPYNAFSTRLGTEVFADGCFEKWGKSYDSVLLTDDPYKGMYCNKELFERARKEYPNMYAVAFVMNEEDIKEAIIHEDGMIGSDATVKHGNGHPRAAGTFPRILGKYVREEKALPMIDALRKMSYLPAQRMRLYAKGKIAVHCDADLVIFDPDTIIDRATYEDLLPPDGIEAVYMRGERAVDKQTVLREDLGSFIEPDGRKS